MTTPPKEVAEAAERRLDDSGRWQRIAAATAAAAVVAAVVETILGLVFGG